MTKPDCCDAYVVKRKDLKNDYYFLSFKEYPLTKKCKPGHFIHMEIPSTDIFFRRPMSIAGVRTDRDEIEVIFKVVGKGTNLMKQLQKGDRVNILGPLGLPFTLPKKNETAILVAGGVGFPPLLYLAEEMVNKGYDPKKIEFFYGGRSKPDILEATRIKKLGVNFHPVTEDGTLGEKGLITKPVERYLVENGSKKLRIFSCGPEGMLKAVDELGLKYNIPGQLSLEAPMPCGIGICLGCVVPLRAGGHARVCKEGPVFEIGEVLL